MTARLDATKAASMARGRGRAWPFAAPAAAIDAQRRPRRVDSKLWLKWRRSRPFSVSAAWPLRDSRGSDVKQRVFQQGDRVMWRDASGERQRGHVLQHSHGGLDPDGSERDEEVLVMRDGSSHVSVLPPNALVLSEL
jgi:hypothetical protein